LVIIGNLLKDSFEISHFVKKKNDLTLSSPSILAIKSKIYCAVMESAKTKKVRLLYGIVTPLE